MKTKTTLPTAEQVKSFTKEMINTLPNWDDHDKIQLGGFAKKSWLKAGNSLVFIINKEANQVAYVWCNTYNGAIGKEFFCGGTYLRDIGCSKMWVAGPMTMYSDIHHYVTNPEVAK